MKNILLVILAGLTPAIANADVCEKYWLHLGGLSRHIQVYEPSEATRYRRQSHPGLGMECRSRYFTLAAGEFTNSLDRPLSYYSVSKGLYSLGDFTFYGGLLRGEYGRRYKDPLPLWLPAFYMEYSKGFIGTNVFMLPPASGWNDYLVVFAQFKIGF